MKAVGRNARRRMSAGIRQIILGSSVSMPPIWRFRQGRAVAASLEQHAVTAGLNGVYKRGITEPPAILTDFSG
jgi:hypothetical protein